MNNFLSQKILIFALALLMLLAGNLALAKEINDPTKTGMSARVVGLGNSFVGIADDISSLQFNPAGLHLLNNSQLLSMYTKLIGDVDYIVLGGALPTKFGSLGLGYVRSGVNSIPVTTISGGQIVDTGGGVNYGSNVILLSYGTLLRSPTRKTFLDRLAVGATLKLFSQSISGGGADDTGSGYSLDAGLQYIASKWLTLGLVQQNIFPSLGGRVTWSATNTSEIIPSFTKLGLGAKFTGEFGIFGKRPIGDIKADLDLEFSQKSSPLYHLGIEWIPTRSVTFRGGLDQAVAAQEGGGSQIINNLAFGIGLMAGGISFDYAYHTYNNLSGTETHFFSLSYLGAPAERKEVVVLKIAPPEPEGELDIEKLIRFVESPKKKATYRSSLAVSGEILAERVKKITLNGLDARITNNKFSVEIPLVYGKNPLNIFAYDINGRQLGCLKTSIVRLKKFKDVAQNYFAKDAIEYCSALGVISGYGDGSFLPNKPITRAELCKMLVQAAKLKTASIKYTFKDVPKNHWSLSAISLAVANNWVTGYPDKTFKPNKPLSRAEGVAIFARFANLLIPVKIIESPFPDVAVKDWAAKPITAAKTAGLLKFLAGKPFKLDKKLSRGEAVEIFSKTTFGQKSIKDLRE